LYKRKLGFGFVHFGSQEHL